MGESRAASTGRQLAVAVGDLEHVAAALGFDRDEPLEAAEPAVGVNDEVAGRERWS